MVNDFQFKSGSERVKIKVFRQAHATTPEELSELSRWFYIQLSAMRSCDSSIYRRRLFPLFFLFRPFFFRNGTYRNDAFRPPWEIGSAARVRHPFSAHLSCPGLYFSSGTPPCFPSDKDATRDSPMTYITHENSSGVAWVSDIEALVPAAAYILSLLISVDRPRRG